MSWIAISCRNSSTLAHVLFSLPLAHSYNLLGLDSRGLRQHHPPRQRGGSSRPCFSSHKLIGHPLVIASAGLTDADIHRRGEGGGVRVGTAGRVW
jgi:hypothetical protein